MFQISAALSYSTLKLYYYRSTGRTFIIFCWKKLCTKFWLKFFFLNQHFGRKCFEKNSAIIVKKMLIKIQHFGWYYFKKTVWLKLLRNICQHFWFFSCNFLMWLIKTSTTKSGHLDEHLGHEFRTPRGMIILKHF